MAEWLVEEGIGEHRAALVSGDRILAARIDWPGALAAGLVEDAMLIARAAGSPRGTARFASGEEALVDGLPATAAEGAHLRLQVVRAALPEAGRIKLARARPSQRPPTPAPSLADALQARRVRRIAGWAELWAEAWSGEINFTGGTLMIEPTAALTAIDIDGTMAPAGLAAAAIPPLAAALRRFDLGGTIAVDFPTLMTKPERQKVDKALAAALDAWPHERVAMNGFGLVLLVARLERPSLLHRLTFDRDGAAARLLLRRGEQAAGPGKLELVAPERVRNAVRPDWLDELARRTGRTVTWRIDNTLALPGVYAQTVPA